MSEFLALVIFLQVGEVDVANPWTWALYGGALGIALLFLFLLTVTGNIRTKFELEAWQKQTARSEAQVDTLLPAMREQTQAMRELTVAVRELMEFMRTTMREQRGA